MQDIYASRSDGFAVAPSGIPRDPQCLARRREAGRRQFNRLFDHLTNLATPIDAHIGLANKNVLDFGCGTGALSVALALKGATVTSVDPTELSLQALRWRARYFDLPPERVQPVCVAPRPGLPFGARSFDLVIANSVFEFIPQDRDRYVDDLIRVLRPGGHLVISTENGWYPFNYYTREPLPLLRRQAMLERNLPFGLTYLELRTWVRGCKRRTADLTPLNWFNSLDNVAARREAAGQRTAACAIRLVNDGLKGICRSLRIPSQVLFPYTTYVFQALD